MMTWPMIYGSLAESGQTAQSIQFFNYDFEEYANNDDWSEPGWTSNITWRIYDDAGNNIIYPISSGEWLNTTNTSENNVVMIAGIKEASPNNLSGIVARYLDDENFLLLEAVRNEGKVKLYIKQAGVWTLLNETGSISFLEETTIEYRLECRGNIVTGFRNNVQVATYTLSGTETFGTRVGIYVGSSQPNFSYMSCNSAV